MGAVDDVEFHRRVFGLERMTPASVSALLWDLMGDKTDTATQRVAGWTKSLYGAARRRNHFHDRGSEAARLAETLSCPIGTVTAIPSVNESWDGSGLPSGLAGEAIPLAARILSVAQTAAIWGEAGGPPEVAERLRANAGRRFDPAVVEAATAVLAEVSPKEPTVWMEHLAGDAERWQSIGGTARSIEVVVLAEVFAQIIDSKSPFTAEHSKRVAALAGAMAEKAGMSPAECDGVVLAGLLHDLGKLAVSNLILDHDGPLSDDDWEIMRRHPDDSGRILRECPELRVIAGWAESHHERPDGNGYHQGIAGERLELAGALLAAADAFDAMSADRPYRPSLSTQDALARLRAGKGAQFAPEAVDLLEAVIAER